jgi:hydroxymethylglutaryl-CoA reductase
MVESAVGYVFVPFGVATGFLIDEKRFNIPMAVEEPSVIAAATYAGTMIASHGGLHTWATEPEMVSQIFLEGVPAGRERFLLEKKQSIADELSPLFSSMRKRGGGYRDLEVTRLDDLGVVRVDLLIDVRDAMGANIINTAAEHLRKLVESISGGTALMCILTNESLHRRAGASFRLPLSRLRRGRTNGNEAGRRIALTSKIAHADPSRAVTHNKGVMNGICALALATGNDTRGIEAAVHRWAARDGQYRGVTSFRVDGASLVGEIELPLPFATMGGSVGFHPSTRTALRLLGNPDARTLARIAAGLGLAQNFAALHALVTEGIQKGHMKMHSARLALLAGARGKEVRRLAERIAGIGVYSVEVAAKMLDQLRAGTDNAHRRV